MKSRLALILALSFSLFLSAINTPKAIADTSWLSTFRDTTAMVSSSPLSGLLPDSDSCYVALPESLATSEFNKVFRLYRSPSVITGYEPYQQPGWTQADYDSFMTAVFEDTGSGFSGVFPKVWNYFCEEDLAAAEDSVEFVMDVSGNDSTFTHINISLYHELDFCRGVLPQSSCDVDPTICDPTKRTYESYGFGGQMHNSLIYAVNESEGYALPKAPLMSGAEAGGANLGFSHELGHMAIAANNGVANNGGRSGEFLATCAEFVGGTVWENSYAISRVNQPISEKTYGGRPPYNAYRLFNAYLFAHYSGSPSDITDDLIYKFARTPNQYFSQLTTILNDDFGSLLPGSTVEEKTESLFSQFALARYIDSPTYAGGTYGFGNTGVSPRHFGWFEWGTHAALDTNRVLWMPPDILCGQELRELGPFSTSTWTDTIDTTNSVKTRDLEVAPSASEYFIFRADTTYLAAAGGPRDLEISIQSPSHPSTVEFRIDYIRYNTAVGDLHLTQPSSLEIDLPVDHTGLLDHSFSIENFGDTTKAVVVVVTAVTSDVWWVTLPAHKLNLTYGFERDTLSVPGAFGVIQTAINAAYSNDIIEVAGQALGFPYEESLTLKNNVSLVGVDNGDGYPILDATTDSTGITFPEGANSHSIIENFTVKGSSQTMVNLRGEGKLKNCTFDGTSTDPSTAINADACTDAEVSDCTFILDSGTTITSSAFAGSILRTSSSISGAGTGFDLTGGDATIDSCTVLISGSSSSNLGIGTNGSGTFDITNCLVTSPGGTGIDINAANTTVTRCTVDDTDVGIESALGTVSYSISANHTTAGFNGGLVTYCIASGTNAFGPGDAAKGTDSVNEDPYFCGDGAYTLRYDSYGVPGNNPASSQIGAFLEDCAFGTLARTMVFTDRTLDVWGDWTIPSGKTLTIQGTTTIQSRSTDNQSGGSDPLKTEIIVESGGKLSSVGATLATWKAKSGTPGDWHGIRVKNGGKITFGDFVVEDADYGITVMGEGWIREGEFRDNDMVDLVIEGVNGNSGPDTLEVEDNLFSVDGSRGIELRGNNSGVRIRSNDFELNASNAEGVLDLDAFPPGTPDITPSTTLISSNIFEGKSTNNVGISISDGTASIVENEVFGCKYGIKVTKGSPTIGSQSDSQSDNLLHDNTDGIYTAGTYATPIIRNNQIYDNTTRGLFARSKSNPNLGDFSTDGLNSFSGNPTCIRNGTGTSTIFALGNWWGSCAAPTCNVGTVIVNNWKCSQPSSFVEMEIVAETPAAVGMTVRSVSPNPFTAGTTVHLTLEAGYADVSMTIFDVAGRKLRTLRQPNLAPGDHAIPWDGRNQKGAQVSTGIYFLKVSASNLPEQIVKALVVR